jgi:hypothetical protein
MINIHQLHRDLEKRDKQKGSTYQNVLEKCYYRISYINSKSRDCYCFFSVPTFIFGIPLYNMTKCIIFIMETLINQGFKVIYTHPNLLHISWKEKPKSIEPPPSDDRLGLLNSGNNNQNSIYHSTDIKTLEFKTDNLFS